MCEHEFHYGDRSPTIGALAAAMAKAQRAIKPAAKTKHNPFYSSYYAGLSDIRAACIDALSENELAVFQVVSRSPEGDVVVQTTLAHSSGEWISGEIKMRPRKITKKGQPVPQDPDPRTVDPQTVGLTISYARRYALAAITGVATEDDDGAAGSGTAQTPHAPQAAPAAVPPPSDHAQMMLEQMEACATVEALKEKADQINTTPEFTEYDKAYHLRPAYARMLAAFSGGEK